MSTSTDIEAVVPRRSSILRLARGLVLLSAGIFGFGTALLLRPDQMLVERIELAGNTRVSDVALRHLLDVRNGTTIWGVDLERAERGAEQHPWVREARATRRWPDTLVVEVQEYQPVALLERGGLYYVDGDGTVFLRARADDLDYPVITGVSGGLAEAHPDLPGLVIHDALQLMTSLDERGLVSRDRLSEVAFSSTRGFTVHLRGERGQRGARLLFGLEEQDRQVGRLATLLSKGLDLSKPVLVDLAPATLAIVRPLDPLGGEG